LTAGGRPGRAEEARLQVDAIFADRARQGHRIAQDEIRQRRLPQRRSHAIHPGQGRERGPVRDGHAGPLPDVAGVWPERYGDAAGIGQEAGGSHPARRAQRLAASGPLLVAGRWPAPSAQAPAGLRSKIMILTAVMLLAIGAFCWFAWRRLPRYLHLYQQDDYDGPRLLAWLLSTRSFDWKLSGALLLLGVGWLLTQPTLPPALWLGAMAVCLIA